MQFLPLYLKYYSYSRTHELTSSPPLLHSSLIVCVLSKITVKTLFFLTLTLTLLHSPSTYNCANRMNNYFKINKKRHVFNVEYIISKSFYHLLNIFLESLMSGNKEIKLESENRDKLLNISSIKEYLKGGRAAMI